MAKIDVLTAILRPGAEALGFELWGIEYINQGKHSILRVYIEHDNGITVDDCASVSHQISGVLEVEDPISSQYTLEVSSPGLDRPLFSLPHYELYVDKVISIRCHTGVDGRLKFKGKLVELKNEQLTILVDNEDFVIEFLDIDKGNVVI